MSRRRRPSNQTVAVLNAFLSRPADWRYGYDLTKEIGLKSGTLYPVLMRLTDDGLLESEWHAPSRQGTPARHAYRLSQRGLIFARNVAVSAIVPLGGPGLATG